MILPVRVETSYITMEELLDTYSPDEVLGYCQHCNNYDRNYSCPGFDFDVEAYLKRHKYVVLVLTHVPTDRLRADWDSLKKRHYDSQVGQLHTGDSGESDYDPIAAVSMKAFNMVKDRVSDLLLEAEETYGGISSPPGSCTRCETCMKEMGKPCVYPDKLRHSLESLGFRVNDIYEKFFGIQLEWTKGELPKAFHSCSALFTDREEDIQSRMEKTLKEGMESIRIQ